MLLHLWMASNLWLLSSSNNNFFMNSPHRKDAHFQSHLFIFLLIHLLNNLLILCIFFSYFHLVCLTLIMQSLSQSEINELEHTASDIFRFGIKHVWFTFIILLEIKNNYDDDIMRCMQALIVYRVFFFNSWENQNWAM